MSIADIKDSLTEEMATGAQEVDYIQLYEWWEIVTRILNLIVGLMVGILIIGIPIVCALEIAYIVIPAVSSSVDMLMIKTKGASKNVLSFVFRDARKAMEEAYTDGAGIKQPLWAYLKRKVFVIIFASLLVALVLNGGMVIPDFIKRIFSGLTDLIMSRF